MMGRLAVVTVWLLVGHAVWLGIFWGLLHVPESSVWMLALSALLAVVLVVAAAAITAGASAAWELAQPVGSALRRGLRVAPAALLAALLFGAIWWVTGVVFAWHTGVAGQIDAWIIARTGSPNGRPVHFVIFWMTMFVRWSLALTLASTVLASLVTDGLPTVTRVGWLRSALAPTRFLALTFWFVLFVAIPWQLVDWRPARLSLPLEPWFVAAKLGAIAVAMAVGWALVLRAGHGATEKA
jgi:hypothetical protein